MMDELCHNYRQTDIPSDRISSPLNGYNSQNLVSTLFGVFMTIPIWSMMGDI